MNIDARDKSALASLCGGGVALSLCALGAALGARGFLAAWLTAWWVWAGFALGAQATLWMHRLTGGAWIAPIAATLNFLRGTLPAVGILVLPVPLWPGLLYPWAQAGWEDTASEPAFRHFWFTPSAMALRVIVCIAIWSVLARVDGRAHAGARRSGYAAAGILAYALTISIVAVDLLMSLTPEWYSTAFGLLVVTAQLQSAMAAGVYAGARQASASLRGDLGNMLMMYVMTWAYIAFTQFQIIWAENLPTEISWYIPRLQTGWRVLGLALAILGFGVPMLALLSREFKRSAGCLRALAILLLIVSAAEAAWWVFPSVGAVSWHASWMLPLALTGMGLVVRAAALRFPTAQPRIAIQEDGAERHAASESGREQEEQGRTGEGGHA
jgi:hypothetical protein